MERTGCDAPARPDLFMSFVCNKRGNCAAVGSVPPVQHMENSRKDKTQSCSFLFFFFFFLVPFWQGGDDARLVGQRVSDDVCLQVGATPTSSLHTAVCLRSMLVELQWQNNTTHQWSVTIHQCLHASLSLLFLTRKPNFSFHGDGWRIRRAALVVFVLGGNGWATCTSRFSNKGLPKSEEELWTLLRK